MNMWGSRLLQALKTHDMFTVDFFFLGVIISLLNSQKKIILEGGTELK